MARTVKAPDVRREEILAAARELFATQGVRATTVQDLAKRVGVTRGLVYHYVGDMDSLVTQVLESYIDQFADDVRTWDAHRTPGDIDAAVMECIGLFRRYVPARGDRMETPLPRIDDASLYLRFMDSAVDALVDVLEETTIPAYAAKHPIEIGHIRETFTALIHGLIALVRAQPGLGDDVLAAIVRQTLRLAPSDPQPGSPAHPFTTTSSTLKGE
jgi:AcrR family transcriptional regulator